MNVCIISGHLASRAVVRGKDKNILVFTVVTKQQNGETEPTVSHVPCVVFNPSAELAELFTTQGKGLAIELQGRVNARLKLDEEPRASAEVVVYTKTIRTGTHVATVPVVTKPRIGGLRSVAEVLKSAVA
ncbi:MAG: hypothetical protein PCFJNLEI_01628 [Verrucomicrobiae bacterium]|nr:hypothetical protein [Verrucomicrobiae bacterium]